MKIVVGMLFKEQDWRDVYNFCVQYIKSQLGQSEALYPKLKEMGGRHNPYNLKHGGGFILVRDDNEAVIASSGFCALTAKPEQARRLVPHYERAEGVAVLEHTYVLPEHQAEGIENKLVELQKSRVRQLGYATFYTVLVPAVASHLPIYQKAGFSVFQTDSDGTLHLDVQL